MQYNARVEYTCGVPAALVSPSVAAMSSMIVFILDSRIVRSAVRSFSCSLYLPRNAVRRSRVSAASSAAAAELPSPLAAAAPDACVARMPAFSSSRRLTRSFFCLSRDATSWRNLACEVRSCSSRSSSIFMRRAAAAGDPLPPLPLPFESPPPRSTSVAPPLRLEEEDDDEDEDCASSSARCTRASSCRRRSASLAPVPSSPNDDDDWRALLLPEPEPEEEDELVPPPPPREVVRSASSCCSRRSIFSRKAASSGLGAASANDEEDEEEDDEEEDDEPPPPAIIKPPAVSAGTSFCTKAEISCELAADSSWWCAWCDPNDDDADDEDETGPDECAPEEEEEEEEAEEATVGVFGAPPPFHPLSTSCSAGC